jgi:nicotinamide mononucleotide (NMN) deamidase PncC
MRLLSGASNAYCDGGWLMTETEIKIELLRVGTSQTKIATSINSSRQLVSAVIKGRRTNRNVRAAIAKSIKKPLLEVFPDEAFREPYGRIPKRAGSKT